MTVLDEILAGVREDLAERQSRVSLDDLKRRAARQYPAPEEMTEAQVWSALDQGHDPTRDT